MQIDPAVETDKKCFIVKLGQGWWSYSGSLFEQFTWQVKGADE